MYIRASNISGPVNQISGAEPLHWLDQAQGSLSHVPDLAHAAPAQAGGTKSQQTAWVAQPGTGAACRSVKQHWGLDYGALQTRSDPQTIYLTALLEHCLLWCN